MGAQRILQAVAGLVAVAICVPAGRAAPRASERIAVIHLTPPAAADAPRDAAGKQLEAAIAAAGFDPVTGDGVEDALAGRDVDRDAFELAAALATAQRAYGELRCNEAVPAAKQAIGIAAARQAAGLAVPELARAWTYVLLCEDRDNHVDNALTAATRLRSLAGARPADRASDRASDRPAEIPATIWAKYPAIDTAADLELVELNIDAGDAGESGAAIWIDFQRAGVTPLHLTLPAGDHVIAAALGTRRGWAAGAAVRSQRAVRVPLTEAAGSWSDLARRVAGWHGAPPAATELAWVLARVHARIALIRTGDSITAWGQVGRSELPHVLGAGAAATGTLADADRVLGGVTDRIRAWTDHAPDPDRPLLVEDTGPRRDGPGRRDDGERPTKWWVYAAIGGAAAIGATILIINAAGNDRQRVELHYP